MNKEIGDHNTINNILMTSFKPVKDFPSDKLITSLDFDDSGEFLVVSQQDTITLYNCKSGTEKKVIYSKKYGVNHCKFAHTNNTILHSSTKEDNFIRYLSTHDNKYIRYFKGHKNHVVSMDVSAVNDMFISGSLDETVRIWDLRSPNCQGLANVSGRPQVAIDPTGTIFAIGLDSSSVRFYDFRNFDAGPFGMISQASFGTRSPWCNIKFSNNGKDMLISTSGENLFLANTQDYTVKHSLNFSNAIGMEMDASFTPDGQFVLCGSQDKQIHVWNVETGRKVVSLDSTERIKASSIVKYNPKFNMMVTGGLGLSMWIPCPVPVL